jgi:hypothetical protein
MGVRRGAILALGAAVLVLAPVRAGASTLHHESVPGHYSGGDAHAHRVHFDVTEGRHHEVVHTWVGHHHFAPAEAHGGIWYQSCTQDGFCIHGHWVTEALIRGHWHAPGHEPVLFHARGPGV